MALDPESGTSVKYRYFTTNFVTGDLLAELPVKDVHYTNGLKSAGPFDGKLLVNPEDGSARDLYETTLPGKTALYVVRDNECVWGGLLWSRKYDVKTRVLDLAGAEFTSYLHHRVAWKTWSHEFTGTLVVASSVGTVTLDGLGDFVNIGGTVRLAFKEVANFPYDNYYEITGRSTDTIFTVAVPGVANGTYPEMTVTLRTDNYDYVRSLFDLMNNDFDSLGFRNDEIEPALGIDSTVTNKVLTSNVATLTTATAHGAIPRQTIRVVNIDSTFDGQYVVLDTPTTTTLRYTKVHANVSTAAVSPTVRTVNNKTYTFATFTATFQTSVAHGLSAGDIVVITGVDSPSAETNLFDDTFEVITIPGATTFTVYAVGSADVASSAASGTMTKTPSVTWGTYGSFPGFGTLEISDETPDFAGKNSISIPLRGFELRNIGETLDEYSDTLDGFEYRVNCYFDPLTLQFSQAIELMAVQLPDPPAPGDISPITRFPGATDFIFEYPGNIQNFAFDESAEDAVSRMFVSGNIPDLGNDASQPYAGASAFDVLDAGWPLLDDTHSENDISDETELYERALRYQREAQPPIAKMTMTVNGSKSPVVGTYRPGDWCGVIVDDPFFLGRLQSPLEPRDDMLIRKINAVKVTVTNDTVFPENVELDLMSEWEVDRIGE